MRYWDTPPELTNLRDGRWDPCPANPDFDALSVPWPKPWYLNPPFHSATRFVRKALSEGGPGIMVLPMMSANYIVLEAGLESLPLGRIRWLERDSKKPMSSGTLTVKVVVP